MLGRGQEQVNAEWIVLSLWWVEVYRGEPGLRPRFAPIKFSFIQTGVPALFIDLGLRTDKLIGNDEKMVRYYVPFAEGRRRSADRLRNKFAICAIRGRLGRLCRINEGLIGYEPESRKSRAENPGVQLRTREHGFGHLEAPLCLLKPFSFVS